MKHRDLASGVSLSSDSIQVAATTKTSDGPAGESQDDSSDELEYDFVGDITWVSSSSFLFRFPSFMLNVSL